MVLKEVNLWMVLKEVNWWMVLRELFCHCLLFSLQTVWKTSMHYSCKMCITVVKCTFHCALHCALQFTLCITLCFTVVKCTLHCVLHCALQFTLSFTLCFTVVITLQCVLYNCALYERSLPLAGLFISQVAQNMSAFFKLWRSTVLANLRQNKHWNTIF